jgi:S-adenosylmethionine hydrolase
MQASGIITLTTDFGLGDSYVGVMKGVILGLAPEVRLIDTTHTVHPQNIHQAAYIVDTFHHYFPHGTIHLVVVDPGVGSSRRAIALQTPEAMFVAPDNGVLTYVWRDALVRWGAEACHVAALTNTRYWLSEVSNTFHGRDIFAPVAAHLARGLPLAELGERLPMLAEALLEQPGHGRNGELIGRIIHIDNFGNCVTNIEPRHLEAVGPSDQLTFKIIDQHISGLHRTYADASNGCLIALVGSSNRIELAVCGGNAAQTVGVGIGDSVKVFGSELAREANGG